MNMKDARNEYQLALGRFFDATPKAVFAALAVSAALKDIGAQEEEPQDKHEICRWLWNEWRTLYDNGIVPQKPPKNGP